MADAHVDLVADLADLGRHLPAPDPAADVVGRALERIRDQRVQPHRFSPALLAVAAAIVVIGLTVALIAPARRAVADWIGLGGTRVTSIQTLPEDVGVRLDLGSATGIDDALARAPGPMRLPDAIARPSASFTGRPEGGVSFVWAASSELPEVSGTDVGLLFTAYPADLDRPSVEKLIPSDTTIGHVDVDGTDGYWLAGGPHVFMYLDRDGNPQRAASRLAANTLLWERDGVAYRLESMLERDAALRLVRDISVE